jgi:hypothetical protein
MAATHQQRAPPGTCPGQQDRREDETWSAGPALAKLGSRRTPLGGGRSRVSERPTTGMICQAVSVLSRARACSKRVIMSHTGTEELTSHGHSLVRRQPLLQLRSSSYGK